MASPIPRFPPVTSAVVDSAFDMVVTVTARLVLEPVADLQ